ncbi:hypothetical protein lam_426 [Candidatus Liberibacter americanus str. Sao Paulo]|uniref:Uncharacterized protein n=1 Tax=Candidatus Liberibacter americanus str. Sao Paulo TaxID=1261131 RepID=U6B408_9HYPH|nr:hypothetical protein lam_426 [Candidatus Liberibacter americanus str. Sao Paulo]
MANVLLKTKINTYKENLIHKKNQKSYTKDRKIFIPNLLLFSYSYLLKNKPRDMGQKA